MPINPFLGQIIPTAITFAPSGWALCNGQILPIAQNTALFSLLGTSYGGDGVKTFALPDLQSRVPIGVGHGPGLTAYDLGEPAGVESVSLQPTNGPPHTHGALAFGRTAGDSGKAANNAWASSANSDHRYQNPATQTDKMADVATTTAGSGLPHENRQPYLVLNYIIALEGIYPQRP